MSADRMPSEEINRRALAALESAAALAPDLDAMGLAVEDALDGLTASELMRTAKVLTAWLVTTRWPARMRATLPARST